MRLKTRNLIFLIITLPILLLPLPVNATTRYLPHQSDSFNYYETIDLGSGTGNYQGYTEHQTVTGAETMNTIYSNGTVLSHYSYSWTFSNSSSSTSGNQAANFTWSSTTFHYAKGTDLYQPQMYVNPTVWFYADNTTANGGSFQLLNTQMVVQSPRSSFQLPSEKRYVYAVKAQGTGSGSRNDVYGRFSLTYTWTVFFDPITGYIVGYNYVEQDTSPTQGFTWTENLTVTSTSYPLATAPTPLDILLYVEIIAAVVIVIVIAVAIYAVVRSRRKIPRHAAPLQRPPPTIDLTPQQQPPVQQIVIKEVVKVKCRYCGALIDSTVQACPFCGAPRT